MFDTKSRNDYINMLDYKIEDIKRDKKTQWPIKNIPNKITDYSNTNERRNYINMLSLKNELNKQSLNIDYQPFNPTLEQKAYFVNNNLTAEQMNSLSKNDFDNKKAEIQNKFKINLLSIVDPLLIDTIINNNLFKNSTLSQKFINDRWLHFVEKLKKNYSALSVEGFVGYSKEYIKKYNRDNNITILNDESYENKIKELKMDLLKLEKTDYLTEKEKEKNKLKINQIKAEIVELEKMDKLNIETMKLNKAEEDILNKKLLDDKLMEEQKYKDIITTTEQNRQKMIKNQNKEQQSEAVKNNQLIIESQLEQIENIKNNNKNKIKKEPNEEKKKELIKLEELKNEKEIKITNFVEKAVEKMKDAEEETKAEIFLNKAIIEVNKAETKEEIENIDSESNVSQSTAMTEKNVYTEIPINKEYDQKSEIFVYVNSLYTAQQLKELIKDNIFKSNDPKITMIQKILNNKSSVEDLLNNFKNKGNLDIVNSNIFTLDELKESSDLSYNKAKNKEQLLKIINSTDEGMDKLNNFLNKYQISIKKQLNDIIKLNSNKNEQLGRGIKKLNKFQKKEIILGEIKAGNNNPLLLKFLKIK